MLAFVSEDVIDKVIENLETLEDKPVAIEDFHADQPAVVSYILSDSFKLLEDEERELLLYGCMVIWQSVTERSKEELPLIVGDAIADAEEKNWHTWNTSKAKKFSERVTLFFDKYPQEDLLAFAEDLIMGEEEEGISKEGRELIFITLKTIIDLFTEQ